MPSQYLGTHHICLPCAELDPRKPDGNPSLDCVPLDKLHDQASSSYRTLYSGGFSAYARQKMLGRHLTDSTTALLACGSLLSTIFERCCPLLSIKVKHHFPGSHRQINHSTARRLYISSCKQPCGPGRVSCVVWSSSGEGKVGLVWYTTGNSRNSA